MWASFRAFGAVAQWVLGTSLVLGFGLLVGGLWIDLAPPSWWPAWWHNLAYGQNILASLTSFMIGVPVALVGLDVVVAVREKRLELANAAKVSETVWRDFSAELEAFCADFRVEALESASYLVRLHIDIENLIEFYNDPEGEGYGGIPPEPAMKFIAADIEEKQGEYEALSRYIMDSIGTPTELNAAWVTIISKWKTLDTYVRTIRNNVGLSWFNHVADLHFQEVFRELNNPLPKFAESHRRLVRDLARSPMMPPRNPENDSARFEKWLNTSGFGRNVIDESAFGRAVKRRYERRNEYKRSAEDAGRFLADLTTSIQSVEEQGWPGKANQVID
jgi:hypothetical protein